MITKKQMEAAGLPKNFSPHKKPRPPNKPEKILFITEETFVKGPLYDKKYVIQPEDVGATISVIMSCGDFDYLELTRSINSEIPNKKYDKEMEKYEKEIKKYDEETKKYDEYLQIYNKIIKENLKNKEKRLLARLKKKYESP